MVMFPLVVKGVVLPDMIEEFDGTESLCLAFEKKNKAAEFSQEKHVSLNQNDEITADFDETYDIDVTMHKETKSGAFRVSRREYFLWVRYD